MFAHPALRRGYGKHHGEHVKTICVLILALLSGMVAAKEKPDGFRGYPWGTPWADIDSVTLGTFYLADSTTGIHMTSFRSPDTIFADCHRVTILISFTEGELTSAAITGEGYELFQCLAAYLRKTYGAPNVLPPNVAKSEIGEAKIFDTNKSRAVLTYDVASKEVFLSLEEGLTPHMERMKRIFEENSSSD